MPLIRCGSKTTYSITALLCAAAFQATCWAEPNKSSPVSTPRYIIGADDVLSITVLRHPEFSVSQVIVPKNGVIAVPVVGQVNVEGKTISQLDTLLTARLRWRLNAPEVVVSLEKPRPRPIYVVGSVKNPGIYEYKSGWRITQALAAAGGLAVDADLAAVVVTHDRKRLIDASLSPLLRDPGATQNVVLHSGDTIRFYERKVTVTISGAVSKPGTYSVPTGSGVAQAVGLSGGPTATAALTRATIRHTNGEVVPVNLYNAISQGVAQQNVVLCEGDVIIVPEQKDRVSVLGAVQKPGFFPIDDGRPLHVADVIAQTGGPNSDAALTRATLRRSDGSFHSLNLYKLLVQGVQEDNLELKADDIISIPESRGVTILGEVAKPGTYALEEGIAPHVSDALALAGGLKIKPEQARISILRSAEAGKVIFFNVDPLRLLASGDSTQNSLLQDGDIVSISAVKRATVAINGEVKTPGAYEISEGDGIGTLVAMAGGQTPDATFSQVTVTHRDGTSDSINAVDEVLRGTERQGAPLRDGDQVVIPRATKRVLVVGQVARSGSFALPENRALTIGDALALAGGSYAGVQAKRIVLLRSNGKDVMRQDIYLDRAQEGVLRLAQTLQDNDVLYVPQGRPSRSTLDSITQFLPAAITALVP